MSVGGRALAGQVLDYMEFRARTSSNPRRRSSGSRSTRILITDLPTGVLESACRELVASSRGREGEDLIFEFDGIPLRLAIALIQTADQAAAGALSEAGGYRFGA